MLLAGEPKYYQKLNALFDSDLVCYWPLWDLTGTVATDISHSGFNGVYSGTTLPVLGQTGIGDGKTSPYFGGVEARVNIGSANFSSVANIGEYSISAFFRIPDVDVWTTAEYFYGFNVAAGANSAISIIKNPGIDNSIVCDLNNNTTLTSLISRQMPGRDKWFNVVLTNSITNNISKLYINGSLHASAAVSGTWDGAIDTMWCAIGARFGVLPNTPWKGNIAHVAYINRAITQAEVIRAATVNSKIKRVLFLGDSIAIATPSFADYLVQEYNNGECAIINRAISGADVAGGEATDMPTQVSNSSADNADVIIIELGTSDEVVANIRAVYVAQVNILKANHSDANIYCMSVLPKTSDADRVDKNVELALACTDTGITYWDTDGWITPATDTTDGTHPTAAGHAKIAAEILALLP